MKQSNAIVPVHPNRHGVERYPYLEHNYMGKRIVKFGLDSTGIPVVICENDSNAPFVVAIGYSPRTGHWAYGHYHGNLEGAVKDWKEHCRYQNVDLQDPKTFEFMRAGRYNYNQVSGEYLDDHDYREPGFDTYPQSYQYTIDGMSRDEWESYVDEHILRNPSKKARMLKARGCTDANGVWLGRPKTHHQQSKANKRNTKKSVKKAIRSFNRKNRTRHEWGIFVGRPEGGEANVPTAYWYCTREEAESRLAELRRNNPEFWRNALITCIDIGD